MVIMLYLGLSYIQNDAPKLLLMAQPLKHPSPSLRYGVVTNTIGIQFDGRSTGV